MAEWERFANRPYAIYGRGGEGGWMYWLEVSVVADGEAAEAVADVLRPLAYQEGVVLEQAPVQQGDPRGPDPTAIELEPEVTVKIYLPGNEDTPAKRQRIREVLYYLGRLYPIPEPAFRKLADQDWAEAWKAHYTPFRVGRRLWIRPSWTTLEEAAAADDVILTLDPGMAFGTGLHPTTQMCLQALERLARPGMRVLDVGTGSGILAIAALRLGATSALAVDNDPQAVAAAGENALANGVAGQMDVREGSLSGVTGRGQWDLVLVNILAPVIVSLIQEDGLLDYVTAGGRLLLSGIIDEQAPAVREALAAAGGFVVDEMTVRDWVTLIAGRPLAEEASGGPRKNATTITPGHDASA